MRRYRYSIGLAAGLLAGAVVCVSLTAGPLVFDKSEYAARRAKLMDRVADGAAVVLGAHSPTAFVPFVQSNDFLYLTGVEAPNAALVVDGKRRESVLFLTLTERAARSDGISLELVNNPQAATGIERVLPVDQLLNYLTRLGSQAYVFYTPFQPEELARECSLEKLGTLMRTVTNNPLDGRLTREQQFVRLMRDRSPAAVIKDASPLIWALRVYKSPAEVELLRRAGRIGVQAYREVLKAVRPGMPEYELAALFEYHCKKAGAQDLAYYAVICSGENHPYVHYYKHDRILADGDIVVMDCGPDLNNYDIDITITFPANGKFTPRQKEVYEAVLAVHTANLSLYRPGLKAAEIREKVREILLGRGLKLDKDAFTMLGGGFGHYVGLAVHDVGGGPAVLEPGMVFANEPMAIFAAEKIGVRIENTILITDSGMENLTAGIPRETKELEAFMRDKK